MTKSDERTDKKRHLPIGRARDVEYSRELADADDREAAERAKRAEERQSGESG